MNTFGRIFRVSIYGESHGEGVGVLIDGVKPGIPLNSTDFYCDLNRRKPGGIGTTTRIETDEPHLISGIFNGVTTGAPLMISFQNQNTNSKDYSAFLDMPRPSHADYTAQIKYKGFQDYRGGGHFSGRLTTAIVAAGVVAKKILSCSFETKVIQVKDSKNEAEFEDIIKNAALNKDSVGGIVEIVVKDIERGLGEPFFDSLESLISHALFSVGGVKGVEFGVGFEGAKLMGSQFNDTFMNSQGQTKTNHNGGINGGISNGNNLVIRIFVKPTPSIFMPQETYNFKSNQLETLCIQGRHDAAIVMRAQVVLEAMVAITLADATMLKKALD